MTDAPTATPTAADTFDDWIGRTAERTDTLTPRLVAEFAAMLAPHHAPRAVPPGAFWCLAPDIVPAADLGRDGHPRLGLVLPDVGLPRRMWAGGELTFHGDFAPGDEVTKTSTIENVAFKEGRSGRLGFVTVRHRYTVGGALVLDERQDIVYRDPTGARPAVAAPPALPDADRWTLESTPTLLFRFSALTYNGHRIHYDLPYVTGVEGYDGLVVHGPMQAALMLNLVTVRLGRLPSSFAYRGEAPLICGTPFTVEAGGPDEAIGARVLSPAGAVTMSATASA